MSRAGEFLEAVKRGDTSAIADLLHERNELVRFADEYGKTGLHWAAETEHVEAVSCRRRTWKAQRGQVNRRVGRNRQAAQLNLLHSLNFTYDSRILFNYPEQKR
jgi:ankyrin repeat protein